MRIVILRSAIEDLARGREFYDLHMKKRTKRVIVASVCLLGVAFVTLNVLAYNHAYAMMHFTSQGGRTREPERLAGLAKFKVLVVGVNIPRPKSDLQPSAVDPNCRVLLIGEPQSVRLAAWYCDRGSNTPLVTLFHGYSADKSSLIDEATTFLALGTSVLLVDFRGSGESSESYTTIGCGRQTTWRRLPGTRHLTSGTPA